MPCPGGMGYNRLTGLAESREKGSGFMRDGIRLIASDIDGTLLREGAAEIPLELFVHIRRLADRGILFCPASGRQYQSLRKLFAPVADSLPYLCENGAVVYGPGNPAPVWSKTVMDRTKAEELSRDILAQPGAEVLISGANTSLGESLLRRRGHRGKHGPFHKPEKFQRGSDHLCGYRDIQRQGGGGESDVYRTRLPLGALLL